MIGNNIKKAREIKGLSQKKLSEISGIPQISLGRYERNERTPNIDTLKKISDSLNINLNTLINWTSNLCTHEDIANFLYDVLDADYDTIASKLVPILKEDDLFKISQFINLLTPNKNFYTLISDFIGLNEEQIYTWVLSSCIYNFNSYISGCIIEYSEVFNDMVDDKNFTMIDFHKTLVNELDFPEYILGLLDIVTDEPFSRYKTFITFEDAKLLISNNLLDAENLDKIISVGLSDQNYKILIDFILEKKKFNDSIASADTLISNTINFIDNQQLREDLKSKISKINNLRPILKEYGLSFNMFKENSKILVGVTIDSENFYQKFTLDDFLHFIDKILWGIEREIDYLKRLYEQNDENKK